MSPRLPGPGRVTVRALCREGGQGGGLNTLTSLLSSTPAPAPPTAGLTTWSSGPENQRCGPWDGAGQRRVCMWWQGGGASGGTLSENNPMSYRKGRLGIQKTQVYVSIPCDLDSDALNQWFSNGGVSVPRRTADNVDILGCHHRVGNGCY